MNKILALPASESRDLTSLAARLALGIVLFPHGAQKLLGWFGGFGYQASMEYFTKTVGLPAIIGFAVIVIEFAMPILLVLGWFTRISALLILVIMVGIIITVQHDYFFMNWFGMQKGEGMEFLLLAIGLSIVCFLQGAGKYGIDYCTKMKNHEK